MILGMSPQEPESYGATVKNAGRAALVTDSSQSRTSLQDSDEGEHSFSRGMYGLVPAAAWQVMAFNSSPSCSAEAHDELAAGDGLTRAAWQHTFCYSSNALMLMAASSN